MLVIGLFTELTSVGLRIQLVNNTDRCRQRYAGGKMMSLLKKLLWWKNNQPRQRVRVCLQCGMPVGEHKDWCAVYRAQQANAQRPAAEAGSD